MGDFIMKKVLFFKNAVILTLTALFLRCVGIFFRVWMSGAVGAQGMGLYQVIYSVYIFASTFATSGICTAVTRMVTNSLSRGDKKGTGRVMKISILISLLIALISGTVIYAFASPISRYLIGDVSATNSVKMLTVGLPFLGVCSCIRGYFLARRSTVPTSLGQIIEQSVRIGVIIWLVKKYSHLGLAATTLAVVFGDMVAEGVGTLFIYIIYKFDFAAPKNRSTAAESKKSIFGELTRIALPISAGRYLHTGLRTAENFITPLCFSKYSGSKDDALSQFGMIKAMALPLLLFPASLLSAVSTLMVPEMTEAMAVKNERMIKKTVSRVFEITFLLSFLIGGIFFLASTQIGKAVYDSQSVGYLIKALSPLVPFMYIDLIADGILKGLDQQNILLRNNVTDSVLRIILVVILVPKFGMTGFLGVMLFSNVFTGTLSVARIVRVTKIKFKFLNYFFKLFVAVVLATGITEILCKNLREKAILYILVTALGVTLLYFVLVVCFGCLNLGDFLGKIPRKSKKV